MRAFVRLLGRPSIRLGEQTWEPAANHRSALLYYLAHAGGWVPRDDLLYLFWPDTDEQRGRVNLRQLLSVARGLPFADGLEIERSRVRWPVDSDRDRWSERLDHDDTAPGDDGWPGILLDGFKLPSAPEFESWLELERSAWHERCRRALLAQAQRDLQHEDADTATRSLERWLDVAPLDEEALRLYLEACHESGRRSTALQRYITFQVRLERELGLAPEARTVTLAERLRSTGDPPPAPVPTPASAQTTRPHASPDRLRQRAARQPFIGRTAELTRLETALLCGDGPVVTLLAAGGMGKTRLALATAERLQRHFADGVAVAWLAQATGLDQVGVALLTALGMAPSPNQAPLQTVLHTIAGQRMLIVLDNVEQLPTLPGLLDRMRQAAPEVAWLLTSRTRLDGLDGSLVELTGLAYPRAAGSDLASFPAVELLQRRAERIGSELDLHRHGDAIVEVCRRTGGMPLALELAAGWLRVMTIDRIATELAAGHATLEAADHDVDARHASVRVVFDASWRALSRAERDALVRLAAFRGGFSEEAARAVAGAGRPLLLALRNKSFLSLDADGRFFQHPLLERYVREQAEHAHEAIAAARERHARWFCDDLAHWEDAGQRGAEREAIASLGAEHANLEAAWAYALDAGWWKPLEQGGALLGMSYHAAGRAMRWSELLQDALARVPPDSATWAVLEVHEASIAEFAGRHHEAYLRRRHAVEVLRGAQDPFSLAWALLLFAESARSLGRTAEARASLEEAVALTTSVDKRQIVGMLLNHLQAAADTVEENERDYEAIRAHRREKSSAEDAIDSDIRYARFLAHTYGDYGQALTTVNAALARQPEARGFPFFGAQRLRGAAEAHLVAGDVASAEADLREALRLAPGPDPMFPRAAAETTAELATALRCRGRDDLVTDLLAPESEAARTFRGLVLRSDLALEHGDLVLARGCADEALALSAHPLVGREGHLERIAALVAAARAMIAGDAPKSARARLLEALAIAREWRFLPALLEVCAAAADLLDDAVRRELRAWAAGHPAASFPLRQRLRGVDPAPVLPTDRETAWHEALGVAARIEVQLAGASGDAA